MNTSKVFWFDASIEGLAPPKTRASDQTCEVLLAILCDNGQKFIDVGRYDTMARQWIDYNGLDGRRVVAWSQLPHFPELHSQ